jgi:SAM-dependent methyltransferase
MKSDPMLTQDEMTRLQADCHDLIATADFRTAEQYVLHLIHTAAYVNAARLVEGKTVLDLGCNTGYGTEVLSRSAGTITGVDVSESAIRAARDTYHESGIDFQVIDGKRLPFEQGRFEVVISFQVIEHIVNHESFIREIKRVLVPGGLVALTTPNAALRLDPGMKPWNEFHVQEFTHDELVSLLEPHFREVSVLGLRAMEPIYTIEVARLERGRKQAKAASGGGRLSIAGLRERTKRSLPRGVLEVARKIRDRACPKADVKIEDLMTKHGLDELFYREGELDSALDLIVLCSDDEAALETCRRMMVKKMA